jgi:uncharacterized hydrophobic protein (TIGR00341 family)
MALRLIEIVVPEGEAKEVKDLLKNQNVLDVWQEIIAGNQARIKVLLPTKETQAVLDLLEKRFYKREDTRIILLPVEASIPRPESEEKPPPLPQDTEPEKKPVKKTARISREELYSDIEKMTRFSWVFIVLIILASVVASVGILRNNVVFIIGAMVIAPVLGPNVGLSLGTTLGDIKLSRRAIETITIGISTALVFSIAIGLVFKVNPDIPELVSRTRVNFGDIALALAAGSAAVLSLTTGLLSALIGVMVAVALLPPLVTLGMLIGSGYWEMASGALILFLINLICINLAGVVTFLAQGIRPLTWWEADRAKRSTRIAIFLWTALLAVLAVLILFSQKG